MCKQQYRLTDCKMEASTVVRYLFNNNKPLKKGKSDHIFIVHYCEKCNCILVGEWIEKNLTAEKKKEITEFAQIKKCAICNSNFSSNQLHHFCNEYLGDYCSDSVLNKVLTIPSHKYFYFSELSLSDSKIPEKGSEIVTDNGIGIFYTVAPSNKKVNIVYHDDTIESILAYLERNLNIKRIEHAEEKIKTFENKHNIVTLGDAKTNIQITDKEKLKAYLKNIMDIEKNIFSISERLRDLYYLNYDAERDALASEKILLFDYNASIQKAKEELKKLKSKKVEKEINIKDFEVSYPEKPKEPKKPQEPILAKPGFFNKKRVLAENAALTKKYENELEIYNLTNEKYLADIKTYKETVASLKKQSEKEYKLAVEKAKEDLENKLIETQSKYDELLKKQEEAKTFAKTKPTPEKAKHLILKDEIKTAEEMLKKYYKAKDKLYSYGVLYEKYRNFVAVSSLCEYLSSGRCDTLEGAYGAYNLYENEIRMNMVICQLNQVVESLEEIKQNQYMIYSAIKETNSLLEALNSSTNEVINTLGEIKLRAANMESYMSKIADNTQVIAYNTERTAFYSKKNAELTNSLGFMIALK